MDTDPLSLCDRDIQGRYRIERQLGAGGMGVVYEATRLDLLHRGERCALKLIRPELRGAGMHPQVIRRFRREARLGHRVDHEGLVKVFDLDRMEDGSLYFAMELLNGRSLAAVLDHGGPMPWELVAEVGIQAASALAALHRERIVHRDLKPENLQLLDDGRLKVLDLGVVHAEAGLLTHDDTDSGARTQTGQMVGTLSYMAPEQIEDSRKADHRSDIYSLGLVLYELCTGIQPFKMRPAAEVLQLKFLPQVLRPLRTHCPQAPAALEALLAQALGPRERRPETMRQVMVMLDQMLPHGRQELRQRLAERARIVALTPLPLWGEPTERDVSPAEVAAGEAVAQTLPAPREEVPTRKGTGWKDRWQTLLPAAGVLLCLLAAVWWTRPAGRRAPAVQPPMPDIAAAATAPVMLARPEPPPPATALPAGPARLTQGQAARPILRRASSVRRVEALPGRLRVAVRPFGEIYLDGVHRTEGSPHTYTLPAGDHSVRAINTAMGRDETRTVKVLPRETLDLMINWEGS